MNGALPACLLPAAHSWLLIHQLIVPTQPWYILVIWVSEGRISEEGRIRREDTTGRALGRSFAHNGGGWLQQRRAIAQLLTAGQPGTSGGHRILRGGSADSGAGSARVRGQSCACACPCVAHRWCVPAGWWLQQWRGRDSGCACDSSTGFTCCACCRRGRQTCCRRRVEVQLLRVRACWYRGHVPLLQTLQYHEESYYEEATSRAPAGRAAAHGATACYYL